MFCYNFGWNSHRVQSVWKLRENFFPDNWSGKVREQVEKLDCNGKDLSKINLNRKSNLKSSKEFHIGLTIEAILKELKSKDMVSRTYFQKFYEMVSKCVKTAASKLFQQSPLNSVIVRTSRVFNPTLIPAENKL